MNLAAVMDDLGSALETVEGLRVFPYWTDRLNPPAAIVGWPEPLTFDQSFGRGMDQAELPIYVAVGKNSARSARDLLAQYADGSGPLSVKAAVEGFEEATAYDTARVVRVEFDVLTVAAVEYLAATFYTDIRGSGS